MVAHIKQHPRHVSMVLNSPHRQALLRAELSRASLADTYNLLLAYSTPEDILPNVDRPVITPSQCSMRRHHRLDPSHLCILWAPPLIQNSDSLDIRDKVLFVSATPVLTEVIGEDWMVKCFKSLWSAMRVMMQSHHHNKEDEDPGTRESAGEDLVLGNLAMQIICEHPALYAVRQRFLRENDFPIEEAINCPSRVINPQWQIYY